jgi:hypothetical protein
MLYKLMSNLICDNYSNGDFEVFYNNKKQYITNFWYTNNKDVK